MSGALRGTRVVDLTRYVAGSYATMMLAALGAEVLKIEMPPDGDDYRQQGAVRTGGESVLFRSLNRGKRSVLLDFRDSEGLAALEHMLGDADFFVHNSRPGVLDAYGLGYPDLASRHPRLIHASISGYGDVGPDAGRGGFDVVLQAESGIMSVTGSPESGPVKVGAPLLDIGASVSLVVAMLAAHVERERTNLGCAVTSSLLEFAVSGMTTLAADTLATGVSPGLLGTHSPTFAPYGGFRAVDGHLVIAGSGSERLWRALCDEVGLSYLVDDPRFLDNASRLVHREALHQLIDRSLQTDTAQSWADRLNARGVPAGMVRGLGEVLRSPQVEALGLVQSGAGGERAVGLPFRIAGQRPSLTPAPHLGVDTDAVLSNTSSDAVGLDDIDDELARDVLRRCIELAGIPAPPRDEGDRVRYVEGWWRSVLETVIVDAVGNVWGQVRTGDGPAVVIAAHLDTVFSRDVPHQVCRNGPLLEGPSVGDNSVGVASLLALDELLPDVVGVPVWILATVGEEGHGDLFGIRHALDNSPTPIGSVIAVEGNWLGRICTTAVGSRRYRVTCAGPGGHAWEAADVDSAVHVISRAASAVVDVAGTRPARTAVNIGVIGGGTAINARAADAWFEVDIRADEQSALEALDRRVRDAISSIVSSLVLEVRPIGERPAGSIAGGHPLVVAARRALEDAGLDAVITAGSTDANAAHAAGLPAIAVGVTVGANEHTESEWIDPAPLASGIRVLAATVVNYTEGIM